MLIIIVFCVALYIWLWHGDYNSKIEPPVYPGYLPFIGHANVLRGSTKHFWKAIKTLSYTSLKAGGVTTFWIGPKKLYLLANPQDISAVASACVNKSYIYDFAVPWLGQGLLTGNSTWKTHRKLLNPSFHQNVLYSFLDVFNEQSRRLVKDLENKIGVGPFDAFPYIRQNGLITLCLTSMGVDLSNQNTQSTEYTEHIEDELNIVASRIQNLHLYSNFIYNLSSMKKREDINLKVLHRFSDAVLQKRKEDYLSNRDLKLKDSTFKPFIDRLLELAIEQNAFSDEEVRDHIHTFIAAGHDTSANAIMFIILYIGCHPQVQEKIIAEMKTVLGDEDRDVTREDLSKLIYLEAVIKETLRFCPIAPVVSRKIHTDIKLRNFTLMGGASCFLLIYGAHRHPMWGSDAEEFKPERWLDRATLPDCPSAFIGFSTGKRNCIGMAYAYMTIKTLLCHILRNFEVKSDINKLVIKLDIVLKPVSGHHITLQRRKM